MSFTVTEEAVQSLKDTAAQLGEIQENMKTACSDLKSVFDDNRAGCGEHTASIQALIEDLETITDDASKVIRVLSLKLVKASLIRRDHIDTDNYAGAAAGAMGIAVGGLAAGMAAGVAAGGMTGGGSGSDFAGGSAAGGNTSGDGNSTDLYGRGGESFTPLLETAQETRDITLDGKECTVFDHPFEGKGNQIHSQGSAEPEYGKNTCGYCASGSIINKAGGNTNERKVLDYANDNVPGFNREGWSNMKEWVQVLKGAGIGSKPHTHDTMEKLAEYVEQGRGVIIGVEAGILYGGNIRGGHAITLESVIRDKNTGEIVSYVIGDSNEKDQYNVCQVVPKARLEKAYNRQAGIWSQILNYKCAVVTDEVIW